MRSFKFASSVFFLMATMYAGAQTCPAVKVQQGALQGTCDDKVAAYKGIPYAQPPVGDLRWKAPQPPKPWEGTRSAVEFSASCIQDLQRERLPWSKPFMAQNAMSEDCLTLNVWTPKGSSGQALPVYLFIHGGGAVEGSSEIQVYDGRNLASHGIVVVTINYRLGPLGYMAHPELTAESPHHASGNYGLQDAVAALKWVQANIKAFNGDPSRVTISGQSAGSRAVHSLAISPLAKGLFANAIAESGSSYSRVPTATLAEAEQGGLAVAKELHANSLADLRKLPAETFVPSRFANVKGVRMGPMIDGYSLPGEQLDIYAKGQENPVRWITGMQADEGSSAPTYGKLTAEQFRKQAEERYKEMAAKFLALYPAENPESQKQAARDRGMVSLYMWASAAAKSGKAPVYIYYFNQPTPWPEHPEFAAFHTSEIPYDLDNLDKGGHPYGAVDREVSRKMVGYWTSFFATGDPNGKELPKWNALQPGTTGIMEIGPNTGMRPLMSKEKMEFWKALLLSPISEGTVDR